MKASFVQNEIPVTHVVRPDVNREFLTFPVNEWDEVKQLTKKVMTYEGRKFTFSGWNSDRNECFFYRPLNVKNSIEH